MGDGLRVAEKVLEAHGSSLEHLCCAWRHPSIRKFQFGGILSPSRRISPLSRVHQDSESVTERGNHNHVQRQSSTQTCGQAAQGRRRSRDFEKAIENLPIELRGKTPKGAEHSAWELLEHLRIAQWDILEFSRDPATSRRSGLRNIGREPKRLPMQRRGTEACMRLARI